MRTQAVVAITAGLAAMALASCGSNGEQASDTPGVTPGRPGTTEPSGSTEPAGQTVPPVGSGGGAATTAALPRPVIDPGDGGDYRPQVDPGKLSSSIDNPFLPFAPGMRWVYEEQGAGRDGEVITVEVLDTRRV